MEKQSLISVIVPVYKAELSLEKCVHSILNQSYKNLEIILVDDGSPDNSGQICDRLAMQDERIKVIHKQNGGQAAARNAALDIITGEYVAFVDSDDYIELNMYEHLIGLLIKNDAQIAACGIAVEYSNGTTKYFNQNYPSENKIELYSMIEALGESFNNQKITYSPCDKLYKSFIFSTLRMTEGKIYEDMEIIPRCIELTEKIVYDPVPLYHYIMTDESTIRGKFNIKRFAEADVAYAKAQEYKIKYPNLYNRAVASFIEIALSILYKSYKIAECDLQRKKLKETLKAFQSPEAVALLGKKIKWKLKIYNISEICFIMFMKLYEFIKLK